MNHEEAVELLGAYALDAVEPVEAAELGEHVATCPRCREELATHRQVAAMLGNVGGAAPDHLWDAIESSIGSDEARGARREPVSPVLAPIQPISHRQKPKRSIAGRVAVAVSVAAAAAIAVLGIQVAHLNKQVTQARHTASAGDLSRAAESALLDPSATRIPLKTTLGHQVVAEVVTTASGSGFMFNQGLPALPASRAYQLWALSGGKAISAGVLGAHPATVAFTYGQASAAAGFALTVEPAAGSVTPTGSPVASGSTQSA
jgi:hypothetical protein